MTPKSLRQTPLPRRSKVILALAALGLAGAVVLLAIRLLAPPRRPAPPSPPPEEAAHFPPPPAPAEIAEPAPPLEIKRQPPPERGERPRIALIVDDLGRSLDDLDVLAGLRVPLTYAVLPYESRTAQVVAELNRRDAEIICHLPMQGQDGANPGPGALFLGMSRAELTAATREALAAVPGAVGVNNHMGSVFSAERDAVTTVVEVLAESELYFIDSRTGPDTVGYSVARQAGLRAAERQVFLDTDRTPDAIRGQFARLLEVARERGGAIAIGHPYRETLEVLAAEVEAARELGFEFVTASSLLDGV